MSVEKNEATVRKLFAGLSNGNLSVIDECLSSRFVRHSPGWADMGREEYKRVREQSLTAMPSETSVDDIVSQEDRVAFRVTHRGVHRGPMMGRPATDKSFEVSEVYFARFEDGKVVEWWCLLDKTSMDDQLSGKVKPPRRIE